MRNGVARHCANTQTPLTPTSHLGHMLYLRLPIYKEHVFQVATDANACEQVATLSQ